MAVSHVAMYIEHPKWGKTILQTACTSLSLLILFEVGSAKAICGTGCATTCNYNRSACTDAHSTPTLSRTGAGAGATALRFSRTFPPLVKEEKTLQAARAQCAGLSINSRGLHLSAAFPRVGLLELEPPSQLSTPHHLKLQLDIKTIDPCKMTPCLQGRWELGPGRFGFGLSLARPRPHSLRTSFQELPRAFDFDFGAMRCSKEYRGPTSRLSQML